MKYFKQLLEKFFKTSSSKRIPLAGEQWIFDFNDGSPWPQNFGPVVNILEVRDGWVRYDMGPLFNDCRTRLELFTRMYRPNNIIENTNNNMENFNIEKPINMNCKKKKFIDRTIIIIAISFAIGFCFDPAVVLMLLILVFMIFVIAEICFDEPI